MNPQQSMKQALQGIKIFAQEPALSIFRFFSKRACDRARVCQ